MNVMKRLLGLLALSAAALPAAHAGTRLGVISYWPADPALYDRLPEDAVALVNPDNGIFVSAGQTSTVSPNAAAYKPIVAKAASRDITILGYVPTGYFNHGCDAIGQCQTWGRIEAQVKQYFKQYPRLTGIFFDETAPSLWECSAFVAEYQRLRDIVYKYSPRATIAYNAGVPDNCAVAGAEKGDILVLFENSQEAYAAQAENVRVSTQTALDKGVTPWHLVHSVKTAEALDTVLKQAFSTHVDLVYATDIGGDWQHGENTWGSLPVYWAEEVDAVAKLADALLPSCGKDGFPTTGVSVTKADWQDIGKTGYLYLGAKDTRGNKWFHDGIRWNRQGQGDRSVYTSRQLTGLINFENRALAEALKGFPAASVVDAMWVGYAPLDDLDGLKARQRVCLRK